MKKQWIKNVKGGSGKYMMIIAVLQNYSPLFYVIQDLQLGIIWLHMQSDKGGHEQIFLPSSDNDKYDYFFPLRTL